MTTEQMPEESRMPADEVDELTKGFKGRERWQAAARVAEERGYWLGWETALSQRMSFNLALTVDAPEVDMMVQCPACNGTGKMHGWGDQCKRCYGATVVKASSVEEGNG